MPKNLKFNETQVHDIIGMFNTGKAINAIAREMQTTPVTIKSYLKKAGLHKHPKKKAPTKKASPKKHQQPKATAKKTATIKPANTEKTGSLEQLIAQMKQTEQEIMSLQKSLSQAVEKQHRQFNRFKKILNI